MAKQIYPEIVVPNHRYRGPMESRKDNEFLEDVFTSLNAAKKAFADVESKLTTTEGKVDLMNSENGTIHQQLFAGQQTLSKLRGGELR